MQYPSSNYAFEIPPPPPRHLQFNDRNTMTTRKDKFQPVQQQYMQQYRMEQMQGNFHGYQEYQSEINKIMDEPRLHVNQRQLDRNQDDAILFNRNIMPTYNDAPFSQDTRRQHSQVQAPSALERSLPNGEHSARFDFDNMNIDRMQWQK